MNKTINIFIPAAGFGERLRPITFHIPKPLLPILGKPALQHVLERVISLPVNKVGINLHHKKEAIEDWISKYFIGRSGLNLSLHPIPGRNNPGHRRGLKECRSLFKQRDLSCAQFGHTFRYRSAGAA